MYPLWGLCNTILLLRVIPLDTINNHTLKHLAPGGPENNTASIVSIFCPFIWNCLLAPSYISISGFKPPSYLENTSFECTYRDSNLITLWFFHRRVENSSAGVNQSTPWPTCTFTSSAPTLSSWEDLSDVQNVLASQIHSPASKLISDFLPPSKLLAESLGKVLPATRSVYPFPPSIYSLLSVLSILDVRMCSPPSSSVIFNYFVFPRLARLIQPFM